MTCLGAATYPDESSSNIRRIVGADEIQRGNALVGTGNPVGLLLGFREKKEDVTRKVKDLIQ